MRATKPKRKSDRELTVTCGWANGRKVKFVGFADTTQERGLAIHNVGPTTTIISGTPGRGDAIVELDGERLACWFRNLNPFPAHVVVVHEDLCHLGLQQLDAVDTLDKIADLGVKFFRTDHKAVCSRLKRMVAKYGEFAWVQYGHKSAVLVVGVTPHK